MKKHYIYILAAVLALASCSKEGTDPGAGKSPLKVTADLTGAVPTKASGNTWASGDAVIGYIQHVDKSTAPVTVISDASFRSSLVNFTVNSDKTTLSVPAGPLYWEDYSNSVVGGKDLRLTDHALRIFYGYCYNGGTPSTALTDATGVLGWTVATNQNVSAGITPNDLLWAPTQAPVTYVKNTSAAAAHGTLNMPFTHAMSLFTINLTLGDGFASTYTLNNTVVTLKQMNTVCTATAPTGVLSAIGTPADITMKRGSTSTPKQCTYQAVVAPSQIAAVGSLFATITNADGNDYEVNASAQMHDATGTYWGTQLETGDITKSGVNYVLNITVNKAGIDVTATITDWVDVTAETTDAPIVFTADVVNVSGTTGTAITTDDASFEVYHATTTTMPSTADAVATYDDAAAEWSLSPALYWENGSTSYYFRGLAVYDPTYTTTATGASTALAQGGSDMLWGTTSAHTGTEADSTPHSYTEGQAINPRTGKVPMVFSHAMSKLTVNLETHATDTDKQVTLAGATVEITNIYGSATLKLSDGSIDYTGKTRSTAITDFASKNYPVTGKTTLDEYLVIPQTLPNDTKIRITLADGTTYSLQLNTCNVDGTTTPITEWVSSKHYIYTIHLEKEAIRFCAYIKDWTETSGSGTAEMEWD